MTTGLLFHLLILIIGIDMRSNKGLSLTEVCVTLCIAGIIAGVGLNQFGKTMKKSDERNLCDNAKLWTTAVKTCLLRYSSMGGWKVDHASAGIIYPCKATNTNELTKKLKFTCPEGVTCVGVTDKTDSDANTASSYYCLNITKGQAQVIVHFDIDTQAYKIYSGKPATLETVNTNSCVASPSYSKFQQDTDSDGNTTPKDELCKTREGTT